MAETRQTIFDKLELFTFVCLFVWGLWWVFLFVFWFLGFFKEEIPLMGNIFLDTGVQFETRAPFH